MAKPIDKAVKALATAGGVAHGAFFLLFVSRLFAGGVVGKGLNLLFALLALLGLAAEFVGWALVRFGGRTRARRLGILAIALSTALASVLLFVASFG